MAIEGRILITGGRGFLGRHLVPELKKLGYSDIRCVGKSDADLVSQYATSRLMCDLSPEIVIHLAANVGGIGANLHAGGQFFYDNMQMGLNAIEFARIAGASKFIQIGTVCSYPKFASIPFKEEDLYRGYPEETNAPYGIAKRALHTMLSAYRHQYNFNGIYLLPVNMYGPGDNFDIVTGHVIPVIINKIQYAIDAKESSIMCYGTGTATREFIHVRDAARGIALATQKHDGPAAVNIGSGSEIQIDSLIYMIAKIMDWDGEVEFNSDMPDGQPKRKLDVHRAKHLFGFEAEIILEKGIQETVRWYRRNRG